jgi:hypothetical protein
MNNKLMIELYHKARIICEDSEDNSAWNFEGEFIKVVVDECIKVASAYEYNLDADPQYEIIHAIKEHFKLNE